LDLGEDRDTYFAWQAGLTTGLFVDPLGSTSGEKMKLVIAEKPSVGKEIAALVGARTRGQGCLQGNGWIVSWCFGHLVELADPAQLNEAWSRWGLELLPMLPERMQLAVRKGADEQVDVLRELLGRGDLEQIINACDAGREGEHIFRCLIKYLDISPTDKRLYRLWTSSLTEQALRSAIDDIKPATRWDALGAAAQARSEADWLVGLNATRALTCKARQGGYSGGVLSVGRVQTPTLALVVQRDLEREGFASQRFYEVEVRLLATQGEPQHTFYVGKWINQSGHSRLATKAEADQIVERLKQQVTGHIERLERKQERVGAPRFFDLTSLQREANKRHGLTAQQTLDAAQGLYEAKLITYPRTDSRAISQDMVPGFEPMCAALERLGDMEQVSQAAASARLTLDKHLPRHVRPEEVSDHHAILPTGERPRPEQLGGEQALVYELVVRRTLAALLEDGVDEVARAHTRLGQDLLATSTRGRSEPGWRLVWEAGIPAPKKTPARGKKNKEQAEQSEEAGGATTLAAVFVQGSKVLREQVSVREGKTAPPAAYTEAALLGAMEHALKGLVSEQELDEGESAPEGGLGTPATRASILETLVRRSYLAREGKSLVSTQLGREVIAALPAGQITNASWTARWEQGLARIEHGALPYDTFMAKVRVFTKAVVEQLANGPALALTDMNAVSPCPVCKTGQVKAFEKGWGCNNRAAQCKFVIWKNVAGKDLSEPQVRDLIAGKTTRKLKGFKSKAGAEFEASLRLNAEYKVEFVFDKK
jgi:DNA topoisomerase III